MVLRGRGGPIDAGRPFDDVEIDFQYSVLGPDKVDDRCAIGLDQFARRISALPQHQVLGRLHGNRAGPAQPFAIAIFLDDRADRLPIDAMVAAK